MPVDKGTLRWSEIDASLEAFGLGPDTEEGTLLCPKEEERLLREGVT